MKTTIYPEGPGSRQPTPNEIEKLKPQNNKALSRKSRAEWVTAAALILLLILPLTFGVIRLIQLAHGAEINPDNARFFAAPLPVALHIVASAAYGVLGAFQFVNSFRKRWPVWHRVVGRLLVVCGLVVGLSGVWMTLFYPRPNGTGELLFVIRLVFGSGMVISIVMGYVTILRGDVIGHRSWMMRAYAIGLGAGTQVLTGLAGSLVLGTPDEFSNALLMGAGWVINLAIAEWSLRRKRVNQSHAIGKAKQ